jgi:hypothetical protein
MTGFMQVQFIKQQTVSVKIHLNMVANIVKIYCIMDNFYKNFDNFKSPCKKIDIILNSTLSMI